LSGCSISLSPIVIIIIIIARVEAAVNKKNFTVYVISPDFSKTFEMENDSGVYSVNSVNGP